MHLRMLVAPTVGPILMKRNQKKYDFVAAVGEVVTLQDRDVLPCRPDGTECANELSNLTAGTACGGSNDAQTCCAFKHA